MKAFKKKAIASLAVATLSLVMGINASAAPVYDDSWNVVHVNAPGVPSTAGTTDYCFMYYSTYGIEVFCNEVSNTVDGGTGRVTISCETSNVTMSPQYLKNTGRSVTCEPSFTGSIEGINLKFTAYTSNVENTFRAAGTAHTNLTP